MRLTPNRCDSEASVPSRSPGVSSSANSAAQICRTMRPDSVSAPLSQSPLETGSMPDRGGAASTGSNARFTWRMPQ